MQNKRMRARRIVTPSDNSLLWTQNLKRGGGDFDCVDEDEDANWLVDSSLDGLLTDFRIVLLATR